MQSKRILAVMTSARAVKKSHKKNNSNVFFINTLLAFAVSVWSVSGFSALTDNLGVSTKAMSLGNAVTAAPPGIMSIHFNPAGLTQLPGTNFEWHLLAPKFQFDLDFIAPPGWEGVFGFTDDPVVGQSSSSGQMSLLIPYVGMVDFPEVFALPLGGFSVQSRKNPKLFFANAIYAPAALGYTRDDDSDPARFGGRKLALERITYLSPSLAYKYSDELSFGLSVGFNYTAFAANTDFRVPNELIGLIRVIQDDICPELGSLGGLLPDCLGEGLGPFDNIANLDIWGDDGVTLSYNLGILWEPKPWVSMGAVYQSGYTANLRGEFEITNSFGFQSTFNALGSSVLGPIIQAIGLPVSVGEKEEGDVKVDLVMPQRVQMGLKFTPTKNYFHMPTKKMQFTVDWSWADWGQWDAITIDFDRATNVTRLAAFLGLAELDSLALPRGYRSVGNWGFGFQFDITKKTQLRMGWEPRTGSVPDDKIDTIAPLAYADFYSLGFGYKWAPDREMDFTVSYLVSEIYAPAESSCNLNCSGINNIVYNPYASLDVNIKTQALILGATFKYNF